MIYSAHFTVRHYECDAYGHLNNANYLRYMEQAAIEASASIGFDDARYLSLGTMWLIHQSDVEYLLPLRAGDEVIVKTWVTDFRRVRSQRRYEFYRAADQALMARASTDWVYIDRATQRPLSVPPEVITAYAPSGLPPVAERQPVPTPLPPPLHPYVLRRRVEWRDIDMAQHVNNANYLNYMEEAAVESIEDFGWSMQKLAAEDIAIVARRHHIAYVQPARLGDWLRVQTFLAHVKRATAARYFTITRESDGERLAYAQSHWVFIHLSSGQIARIPPAIMRDFADHIAPD